MFFYLDLLVVVEDINSQRAIIKVFTEETISTYEFEDYSEEYTDKEPKLLDEIPNPLGVIPAVNVYNLKGNKRPIGISDLADVAYLLQPNNYHKC